MAKKKYRFSIFNLKKMIIVSFTVGFDYPNIKASSINISFDNSPLFVH